MSDPVLITDYLGPLRRQLPAPVVEELADGLFETYQSHLARGLPPGPAAEAAVAEFGEPQVILAEFARVNPARRAAHRLLMAGPAVGGCWAAALITSRAWAWPVPLAMRLLPGLVLVTVIGLLAAAGLGKSSYRLAARAGTAGCIGTALLDALMIIGVAVAIPSMTWATVTAMTLSAGRIALIALTRYQIG